MTAPTSRESEKFVLRLPDGMRDRIKAVADSNGRSMNAEIVATLEEKYPAPRESDVIGMALQLLDFMEAKGPEAEVLGIIQDTRRDIVQSSPAEAEALAEKYLDIMTGTFGAYVPKPSPNEPGSRALGDAVSGG